MMKRSSILFIVVVIVTVTESTSIKFPEVYNSKEIIQRNLEQRDQADGYASYQFQEYSHDNEEETCGSLESTIIFCERLRDYHELTESKPCEKMMEIRKHAHGASDTHNMINLVETSENALGIREYSDSQISLESLNNSRSVDDKKKSPPYCFNKANVLSISNKSFVVDGNLSSSPKNYVKLRTLDNADFVNTKDTACDALETEVGQLFYKIEETLKSCRVDEELRIGCYVPIKESLLHLSEKFQKFNGSAQVAEEIGNRLKLLFEQTSYMDLEATELCLSYPKVDEGCTSFSAERFNQDVEKLFASVKNLWTEVYHRPCARAMHKARVISLRARLSMLELIEMSQLSKSLNTEKIDATLNSIFSILSTLESLFKET